MAKFEDYLRLAEADLKVATLVLNSSNDELILNNAAYHVEQATEKIMKGLLVKNGQVAGISHSIIELSKDLDEAGVSYPEWIHDKDDTISSWATTIRYNVNFKAEHDEIAEIIGLLQDWIREV